MIKNEKHYLTQYCEAMIALNAQGIYSIYDAPEEIQELRIKAKEQSGLTREELSLIVTCRKLGISLFCRKI